MTTESAVDERARLRSLDALSILDSPSEREFDDLVELARAVTGAPSAMVSFVAEDRQWFKARSGIEASETPRDIAFCDHAIREADVMIVPDARADPRFADNPLVTAPGGICFYAGAPIVLADGQAVGTVCVVDSQPRSDFTDAAALAALARQAGKLLELRLLVDRQSSDIEQAQEVIRQSQKMESLGELTGGIAHDFNNLLTIILGNLDIALARIGADGDSRVRRSLSRAVEGAHRAATLTGRLLAFARRQPLAPQAADIGRLLDQSLPLLSQAIDDSIAIAVEVETGVWPVEIDVGQLESAILNLVVNARDAMPEGGAIELSVTNERLSREEAVLQSADPGDYVQIAVSDTGAGMSPAVSSRVFEPFYTTKSVGRGTGLGLSQVHGFVRQSGGFVSIDTAVGRGTIVGLWLPRSGVEPAETLQPDSDAWAKTLARDADIMVVEDNDALRELVVETLRDAGHRVVEAHDGRSALALFARQRPTPALVISDIMMPRLDGFQLAEEIARRSPSTRMLLMTGYTDPKGSDRLPAANILLKPFGPEALLTRVREMLGQG